MKTADIEAGRVYWCRPPVLGSPRVRCKVLARLPGDPHSGWFVVRLVARNGAFVSDSIKLHCARVIEPVA